MKKYLALFLALFACHGAPSHSVGSTVIQPAGPATALTTNVATSPALTADVPTTPLTITGQQPFATATTNKNPGGIILALGKQASSGTNSTADMTITGGNPNTNLFAFGGDPNSDVLPMLWMGQSSPSASNYSLWFQASILQINAPTGILTQVGGAGSGDIQYSTSGNATFFNGTTAIGGSGVKVIGIGNATNPPTTATAGAVLYASTGALTGFGTLNATTTMAPSGSAGTINSQAQILDQAIGTCETVSSATPKTILTYTTKTSTAGFMTLTVISRATTTGTGIAIGDESTNQYIVSYKNVAGTVTLDTTGIVSVGTGYQRTTAAALTVPVLTTSVATNVITFLVANVALATIDSQISAQIVVD